MNKLNPKILGAIGAAVLAFFVATACAAPIDPGPGGSGGGTPGTKNVPGKISADLPKSLTPSSGSGANMRSIAAKAASRTLSPRTIGEESLARSMIVGVIDNMKMSLFTAAEMLVFIDATIEQNGLSTSSSTVSGKSVTITDDMIATIKSLIPDNMVDLFTDYLPAAGTSFELDPFVYNTTTTAPYDFKFSQTYDYGGGFEEEMLVSWDSDKKQVGLSFATPSGQSGAAYEYSISYDDTSKTSTMVSAYDDSSFNYKSTIQIKEDADNTAKHGVVIFFDDRYAMGTDIMSYNAQGVADDDGGYLETTYVSFDSTDMDGTKQTFNYKESFDADGLVTGEAYRLDGGDWTEVGTLDSDYTSDYDDTDFDAIGDEIDDEDYSSSDSSYYFTEALPDGYADDDTYEYYYVFSQSLGAQASDVVPSDYTYFIGGGFAYGYVGETDPVDLEFYYDEQTVGTTVYVYKIVWSDTASDWVFADDPNDTGFALSTAITLTAQ